MINQTSVELIVELSALLGKIETLIYNIETGDSNVTIGCLMNSTFTSQNNYETLRVDAVKELHGLLYHAFYLICNIVLETSDDNLLSITQKSCAQIAELLSVNQIVKQKVPMVQPLIDLYHGSCSKLLNAHRNEISLSIEKLHRILFF